MTGLLVATLLGICSDERQAGAQADWTFFMSSQQSMEWKMEGESVTLPPERARLDVAPVSLKARAETMANILAMVHRF